MAAKVWSAGQAVATMARMESKPKRRWLRFGLRTIFAVVTIFGVWLGWNLKIVRERKAVLAEIDAKRAEFFANGGVSFGKLRGGKISLLAPMSDSVIVQPQHANVSWIRGLMGDESIVLLNMPPKLDIAWIERAEYAFPEAVIWAFEVEGHERAFRDSLYAPAGTRRPNQGTLFKTGLIEK